MKIGFYHEVTWRGNSTTTKWRLVFIIKLLEGDTPPLQNEDWFLYAFIIRLLEGKTSILQNDDWKWLESMRLGFHMLPSEGQLTLLQNEIGFLHVVFRWANSLSTKWLSIFKGLSTTETLKTHKMQFPSSGYKMPGPSPFVHLNLSLERPWNGAQGLPFCSWNSNGDAVRGLLCRSWYFSTSRAALREALWEVFVALVYRANFPWRFVRQHSKVWALSWVPKGELLPIPTLFSDVECVVGRFENSLVMIQPWFVSAKQKHGFTQGRLFEGLHPLSHVIPLWQVFCTSSSARSATQGLGSREVFDEFLVMFGWILAHVFLIGFLWINMFCWSLLELAGGFWPRCQYWHKNVHFSVCS